jgi:hypothetical protein
MNDEEEVDDVNDIIDIIKIISGLKEHNNKIIQQLSILSDLALTRAPRFTRDRLNFEEHFRILQLEGSFQRYYRMPAVAVVLTAVF